MRDRMNVSDSAIDTMPTTAEIILKAAAALCPILPPEFYGRFVFIYEKGRPQRWLKEESGKL